MKKMINSLLAKLAMIVAIGVLSVFTVWADEAVLPNTQALTTSFANVGTDANIKIKTSSANAYTNPLRFYANTTITIQAVSGYVIQSVTYEASSTGNYVTYAQNATVTPSVTPTVSGKNVTWTLDNVTEFTFKPGTQTRANSITIEYSASGGGSSCAAPTFSPAAGAVLSGTTVTLSSATDGASIYYTMGATPADPTTSSTPYSTPISITENTTIKAIAVKDGYDNSTVSSATYSLLTPVNTMDAIFAAATSAGNTATSIAITFNNWVVTGVSDKNAYVTDGTKGFIIFQAGHGFSAGNVLSGTAACKVQLYNGSAEITTLTSSSTGLTVTTGGTVTPVTDIPVANLTGINTGALLSYENLSFNGTYLNDGTGDLKPYNTLYNYGNTFVSGKSYNVAGIYLQYNSTKEILPRKAADIEEAVTSDPSISVSPTSLSGFTYIVGNGPSDTKTISVSGSNLTNDISLSLENSSAYEMSLSAGSGYGSSLNLSPTTGTVAETTVYIRLKADKTAAGYDGTVTLSSTGANNLIVNLSGSVSGAATTSLPFDFDGGRADIEYKDGLSHSGLDSDYGSSPKLKFNSADDYVLLQFNERPGVLSFDLKGNSFSGSTFKVQVSANGVDYSDLKVYNDENFDNTLHNEEFNNLDEDIRFIKWIYTNKSGGNVALGNIALAKYVDPLTIPSISLDSYTIDAPATETGGTLVITYNNLAVSNKSDFAIQYYDADENEIQEEPAWIEVLVADQDPGIGEGYVVSYYMLDNDGAARNAYFKVYAMDNETNLVYSDLVTVTQAKANPIPSGWEEETLDALTEDDVFVIVGINDAGDCFAMSNDNGTSDAPAAVELMGTIPSNVKWNIGGDAVNGYVFYPNGTTETWLYCTNTNNGVRVGTNANNAFALSDGYLKNSATNRYVGVYNSQDWRCYGTNDGNIANQTFKFYKRVVSNTVEPTINITATENDGRFWATFYNAEAQYVLPEGAQAFTLNADKELYRIGKDGRVIPENTAVIIIADKASLTLTQKNAGDGTIHDDALSPVNILRGSSSAVATSNITSGTPYVLGIVGGKLGFYEYTGSSIPANKAYYVVE